MKLIRDRVPLDDGGREGPRVTGGLLVGLFGRKLVEEACEAAAALVAGDRARLTEELADLSEVIAATADRYGLGMIPVRDVQAEKRALRGGFVLGRTYQGRGEM